MAKGDSEFAVAGPECQEVAGEHRRAVARPHRGRSPGTGDPDQAASMGVGPKTWARGEPDAWERARPVRRCGPGKRTLRKKHTAPRPDPYLTLTAQSEPPELIRPTPLLPRTVLRGQPRPSSTARLAGNSMASMSRSWQ